MNHCSVFMSLGTSTRLSHRPSVRSTLTICSHLRFRQYSPCTTAPARQRAYQLKSTANRLFAPLLLPASYLCIRPSYFSVKTGVKPNLRSNMVKALASTSVAADYEPWCWENSLRWTNCIVEPVENATTIQLISPAEYDSWLSERTPFQQQWLSVLGVKGKHRELAVLPSTEGQLQHAVFVVDKRTDLWSFASLVSKLPMGSFRLPEDLDPTVADAAALGWILGHYKFRRYKKNEPVSMADKAVLEWPKTCNRSAVEALARSFYFARDLINTPAEDLGPQHLAAEVGALAACHGVPVTVIQGEELLEKNYPAVHTVGRASHRPPVVADFTWQPDSQDSSVQDRPRVALVGKGVCFDTGGLNIKSSAGMRLMKKDMGGAAFVLALAHLVMSAKLPVSLRVMVPAVENAISANSYRVSDVLQTRAGITVENGNTDAEGRLILSDCLYESASDKPDLIVDVATLTGAARAALGPEMPAVFCNDNEVGGQLLKAATEQGESLWRLPLHAGYRKTLDSKVADLASTSGEGTPGAITAALFLQEFIQNAPRWIHMDTGAWTTGAYSGPGRPEGGEALGLLSFWALLKERYAK